MFSYKWLTKDGKEHRLVDIKDCAMIEGEKGTEGELKDDSGVVHYAIKKPFFGGYTSLCGNNGMNITVNGAIRNNGPDAGN